MVGKGDPASQVSLPAEIETLIQQLEDELDAERPADVQDQEETGMVDESDKASEEAQRRVLNKARKGVLGFVIEAGGSSSLADMHGHSEGQYFIAHQAFSKMMEGMVDDGLLTCDWDTSTATITRRGRMFAEI